MNPESAAGTVAAFLKVSEELFDIAKTAFKNKKSLHGRNFYGDKFQAALISLGKVKGDLDKIFEAVGFNEADINEMRGLISTIESGAEKIPNRSKALKAISYKCQSLVLPKLERFQYEVVPLSEQVLPMAVVKNTRGYIEKVTLQANGCYENQWFDACAVMIRRLVETLIIEVYESKGRAVDIQVNGNFLMLRDLADFILIDKSFNLSRETKKILPDLKQLGDRSAHSRRYLARKADIDNVISGLRVAADELLHLANLK